MAQVETLMLANHAEALNGLLYIHGGGWSHHWRPVTAGHTPPSQFAIAATFLIEPAELGRDFQVVFRIVSEQGEEVMKAEGPLQSAGRPGANDTYTRAAIAVNANVVFPHEGSYTMSTAIGEGGTSAVVFWVHDQSPSDGGSAPSDPDAGTTSGYL